MIGGAFTVNVFGTDVDLSRSGAGMVTLNGAGHDRRRRRTR